MTLKEQISWCKLQIKSGYEVVPIRSILTRLQGIDKKEPTSPLFNEFVAEYKNFIIGRNLPFMMDGRQGKALKDIIEKLTQATINKNDEAVLSSWKFILKNWKLTGDFIGRQIGLSDINRNLLTILDLIRNGADKKQSNRNQAEQLANAINQKHNRYT